MLSKNGIQSISGRAFFAFLALEGSCGEAVHDTAILSLVGEGDITISSKVMAPQGK